MAYHCRGALEGGGGAQRRLQEPLDGRLEEVAEAVGGGYCRLQTPLRLAIGVRGTVAGHRLGALESFKWSVCIVRIRLWLRLPKRYHRPL